MNKFAVVIPYFGKLKPSFVLWYESARRNSDVDFYIFTDDVEPKDRAENVRWVNFTLEQFNSLAVEKLGVQFKITKPYKLCDFKPMYGVIFADYLKGYEYWAYGDLDVVYGRIFEYLQKIDYRKFNKINHAGHFCFIKNDDETNQLFKSRVEGSKNYEDVLESANVAFDELDMNSKACGLNLPFYDGTFSADIMHEAGMQIVDGKRAEHVFKRKSTYPLSRNYHYQLFLLENGRVVRYYRKMLKVKKDEFCYIHYRQELPIYLNDKKADTYIFSFSPKGFFDIDVSKLTNLKTFMKTVKKYNERKPVLIEKFNAGVGIIKRIFKK